LARSEGVAPKKLQENQITCKVDGSALRLANGSTVWAEVFGGGIGGLIARFRPGLEPQPQYMQRAIENWFGEHNATPVRVSRLYETGGEGGR
jgi:hypothetical protein